MTEFVHIPLSPRALARFAGDRGLAAGRLRDDGAVLHHLLTGLFGRGALQPFRLFDPARGDWSLYGYTPGSAAGLVDQAGMVGTPEALAVVALDRIRTRPLPEPRPGQRLGFDIRLRPVRRRTEGSRVRERDAFVTEALRDHLADAGGMAAAGRTREAVYRDWLAERLDGAEIEAARLAQFRRTRILRDGKALEGPDAVLHGTLRVTDAAVFGALLAHGIGRHRAYGYGMMLLRPADAPVPER